MPADESLIVRNQKHDQPTCQGLNLKLDSSYLSQSMFMQEGCLVYRKGADKMDLEG